MARKTKPTLAKPSLAPSISPEKALTRLERLLERLSSVISNRQDSTQLTTWRQDVEGVLSQFYGSPSLQLEQFGDIHFFPMMVYTGQPDSAFTRAMAEGLTLAQGFLRSRIEELKEDLAEPQPFEVTSDASLPKDTKKVFVVHGHDQGGKETVARYLSKLDLEPIILHEQADQGQTIIEKFEHHSDVACAVVILSPDDIASSKIAPTIKEERARQNVILEMGFFIGKLGRKRTFALLQYGVTRPSDIDGVLYIPMNDDSAWRMRLVMELKACGMDLDANKAF
jgi:predicted nucleotide-binding protein